MNRKFQKFADLTKLEQSGIIEAVDDTYTQARKDAALWFDRAHGGFSAADKYFDSPSKAIHAAATQQEQRGFYTYTSGSGGHNRPLAGFQNLGVIPVQVGRNAIIKVQKCLD